MPSKDMPKISSSNGRQLVQLGGEEQKALHLSNFSSRLQCVIVFD
jgi:hypothetical protein